MAQPVFCKPAAIPFMVKIRVSSMPGAYSLVGLSFTSSAAGLLDSIISFDRCGLSITWQLGSRIRFSVYAWHTLRVVMYASRSRSLCFKYGSPSRRSLCPAIYRKQIKIITQKASHGNPNELLFFPYTVPGGGGAQFLHSWSSGAFQITIALLKLGACHTKQLYLGLPWQKPFRLSRL